CHSLRYRINGNMKDVGIHERVVASDTQHKVRSIERYAPQLSVNIFNDRPIYSEQRRTAVRGQELADLRDYLWFTPGIGGVIEDCPPTERHASFSYRSVLSLAFCMALRCPKE